MNRGNGTGANLQRGGVWRVLAVALLAGCATMNAAYGTVHLTLWDVRAIENLPTPPISSSPVTIAIRQIRDGRYAQDAIGNKPFGKVELHPGIVLTEHVRDGIRRALERAGYRVISSAQGQETPEAWCDVLIRDFWVSAALTLTGYDYTGTVKLEVTFREAKSGKELWNRVIAGEHGVAFWTISDGRMEMALNEAFATAVRELVRAAGAPAVKNAVHHV